MPNYDKGMIKQLFVQAAFDDDSPPELNMRTYQAIMRKLFGNHAKSNKLHLSKLNSFDTYQDTSLVAFYLSFEGTMLKCHQCKPPMNEEVEDVKVELIANFDLLTSREPKVTIDIVFLETSEIRQRKVKLEKWI